MSRRGCSAKGSGWRPTGHVHGCFIATALWTRQVMDVF
jgi:hypothetical protein